MCSIKSFEANIPPKGLSIKKTAINWITKKSIFLKQNTLWQKLYIENVKRKIAKKTIFCGAETIQNAVSNVMANKGL